MSAWNPTRTAEFFDAYGEREWTRFEDGRTSRASLETHIRFLERFVRSGDRVLDAGSGPGRFTLELVRLGADVTALDISLRQLELLRSRVDVATVVGDITDLSRFDDATFDVVVCFGGPLSYVGDRAECAAAGLLPTLKPEEPELTEFLVELEARICDDPNALGVGQHMLAALEVAA